MRHFNVEYHGELTTLYLFLQISIYEMLRAPVFESIIWMLVLTVILLAQNLRTTTIKNNNHMAYRLAK